VALQPRALQLHLLELLLLCLEYLLYSEYSTYCTHLLELLPRLVDGLVQVGPPLELLLDRLRHGEGEGEG